MPLERDRERERERETETETETETERLIADKWRHSQGGAAHPRFTSRDREREREREREDKLLTRGISSGGVSGAPER